MIAENVPATRIEITYLDGTKKTAEGAAAAAIMEWWHSCEVFCHARGMEYKGPFLKSDKKDDE